LPSLKIAVSRLPGARAVRHVATAAVFVGAIVLLPAHARAVDPNALFQEALRHDLGGTLTDARRAFELYRAAGEAGLPEAQFNVAVMLDSGRGVAPDLEQAATWYARAASRGNRRAAFNLGQLYESGQGVPQNRGLAHAWFKASDLPAARARMAALGSDPIDSAAFSAPQPVSPVSGEVVASGTRSIDLVWTSRPQPEPVGFFVEVRAVDTSGSREIYFGFVDISSLSVPLTDDSTSYAWRVLAVARGTGRYVASDWSYLHAYP
jgi:hypothetical protein